MGQTSTRCSCALRFAWMLVGFLFFLGVSATGTLHCTCAPPAQEPVSREPVQDNAVTEEDAAEPQSSVECPELRGLACKVEEDCKGPDQPKPEKPACPGIYCGEDQVHSTQAPINPTQPGRLPWDQNYYPPRSDCECRTPCEDLSCIRGICQHVEPTSELPLPPDIPPFEPPPICPSHCERDQDCDPKLCLDLIKCELESRRCINPIVRP